MSQTNVGRIQQALRDLDANRTEQVRGGFFGKLLKKVGGVVKSSSK